jgi:hypothetical protein
MIGVPAVCHMIGVPAVYYMIGVPAVCTWLVCQLFVTWLVCQLCLFKEAHFKKKQWYRNAKRICDIQHNIISVCSAWFMSHLPHVSPLLCSAVHTQN